MSNQVLTVPLLSLYEDAICRKYYAYNDSNAGGEPNCKIPFVQSELAFLRGWQGFFNTISAIIVALPLGYFADRYDKRKIMAVILCGMLAGLLWTVFVAAISALPLRLLWLTSVLYLCGGGNFAAEVVLSAMLVNTTSESQRTQTLYYMYSAFIATELIGPAFAAATANISIWIPFTLGIVCLLSTFVVLYFSPSDQSVNSIRYQSLTVDNSDDDAHTLVERSFWDTVKNTVSIYLSFFEERNMILALPIFLVGMFRAISLRVLLQYTSAKFNWKLANRNILIIVVAVINLALFFVILPFIIRFVTRQYGIHPQKLNLYIVRYSLLDLVLGSILLFLASSSIALFISLGLYALGFGAHTTLLSLATSFFDSKFRAQLYSAILLIGLSGMLIGETLLQNLLSASFSLSKFWFGIPFLVSGGLYFFAFTFAMFIKVPVLPTSVLDTWCWCIDGGKNLT